MFETVTTNAVSILTLIVLWSSLVWVATYMYMTEKIRRMEDLVLDEQWKRVTAENQLFLIENEYGHVIDDYIEHFEPYAEYEVQDDGSWKKVN